MDGVKLFFGALWLIDTGLPTLLFYGWFVLFVYLALRRARSAGLIVLYTVAAVAPVSLYVARYASAALHHRSLEARLFEAQHLPPLASPPRTLVIHSVHSPSSQWQDQLVEMGAFDEIYFTWRDRKSRLVNARHEHCDSGARGNVRSRNVYRARTAYLACAAEAAVDRVPDDGVHLYLSSDEKHQGLPVWSTVDDLRLIEGGQTRQIGFWGWFFTEYPVFPPVLMLNGFAIDRKIVRSPVPWYGEIPFLFERLSIKPADLKPAAMPSPEQVRAEFLRLRDAGNPADLFVAGHIATAVGAAALTEDDIEPIVRSNAVDSDFGREVGFQQFCNHIDRLCDFPNALVAACKATRVVSEDHGVLRPPAAEKCLRIPQQCQWCRTTPRCDPFLTGSTEGCGKEAGAARDAELRPLREN